MNRQEIEAKIHADFNNVKDAFTDTYELVDYLGIDILPSRSWGVKRAKEYIKQVKLLYKFAQSWKDAIDVFGWSDLFSVSFSFDMSGFEYWMKNMKERQYLHITIRVNAEELTEFQYNTLNYIVHRFVDFGEEFCGRNDYDPSKC